jgi:hypothetical protein
MRMRAPLTGESRLIEVAKIMAEGYLRDGLRGGAFQLGVETDEGFILIDFAVTVADGKREDMLPGSSPPIQL